MSTDDHDFELTISYEPAEHGWLTANVPAVPGTISTGRSRDEARVNVLDALRQVLTTPPENVRDAMTERVRVSLELSQGHDLGRDL